MIHQYDVVVVGGAPPELPPQSRSTNRREGGVDRIGGLPWRGIDHA